MKREPNVSLFVNFFILVILLLVVGVFTIRQGHKTTSAEVYDKLNCFELKASTSKNNYKVGDIVNLKFEIATPSVDKEKIHLFGEKCKSLFLNVWTLKSDAAGERVITYGNVRKYGPFLIYFAKGDRAITGKEKIEQIFIDRNNPYCLYVKGTILRDQGTGNIILDFSEFGRFEVLGKADVYQISGFWRPINPHPLDSLEDYTNLVDISISE